jgi:hypothetical protein
MRSRSLVTWLEAQVEAQIDVLLPPVADLSRGGEVIFPPCKRSIRRRAPSMQCSRASSSQRQAR